MRGVIHRTRTTAKDGKDFVLAANSEISPAEAARLMGELTAIVARASALIRAVSPENGHQLKPDQSPVTAADDASEAEILQGLARLLPGVPVVSEEMSARQAPPKLAGSFILVDPLDGTREFVAKNGEFTTNIGLIDGDHPVLGVVHLPVANITYAAAGSGTATRQEQDNAPVSIAARRVPETGAVVIHSRSHGNNADLAAYLATIPGAQTRVTGSAAKFCFVAEGSADLYPRFGPTMEWDTAAGQAIVEAAGGRVTRLDGVPLRYAKPGFRNSQFLAQGRR
jgi:3'(2'), 5'-bisphosphate nucleotidase